MVRMEGRHVVVTGASSGIGRATAAAFAAEGATVWLGARRRDRLEEVVKRLRAAGGAAHAVPLDVTSDQSIGAFTATVASGAPGVDVLVNNAGVGAWGALGTVSSQTWRRVIDTNLTGPFLVTTAMLPLMRQREGRRQIINIASVAGKEGFAGGGAYSASKFGLRGASQSWAMELADEGIRVTCVMPGFVATQLVGAEGATDTRMMRPEDLAGQLVALTLAPESLFVDELTVWPWAMYTE